MQPPPTGGDIHMPDLSMTIARALETLASCGPGSLISGTQSCGLDDYLRYLDTDSSDLSQLRR